MAPKSQSFNKEQIKNWAESRVAENIAKTFNRFLILLKAHTFLMSSYGAPACHLTHCDHRL